ncbi:cupin domain-containing protein [Caballeronia grimmiae]
MRQSVIAFQLWPVLPRSLERMSISTPLSSSARLSAAHLDELIALLEIRVLGLSECLVSEGFVLELDGNDAPGIHYILSGSGLLHIGGADSVPLTPHTLLIVPPRHPLKLEVPANRAGIAPVVVSGREHKRVVDSINRFRAGSTEPMTVMICGYFTAAFGASINLFETHSMPIVEQFDPSDRLDVYLRTAFDELMAQEIGAGAMSGALLKQVIVALVRRSLKTSAVDGTFRTARRPPDCARVRRHYREALRAAYRRKSCADRLSEPLRVHGALLGGLRPGADAGASRHPDAPGRRPVARRGSRARPGGAQRRLREPRSFHTRLSRNLWSRARRVSGNTILILNLIRTALIDSPARRPKRRLATRKPDFCAHLPDPVHGDRS